jgi:ketosteroid isomerase-like protein
VSEDARLEEIVAELSSARVQRLNDGDIDRMVDEFYHEDARLMPPDRPTVEGLEAIRTFWREVPDVGLIELELRCRHVAGSGELAYEGGDFTRTIRPRHGHPFNDVGKYLVIYRRGEDGRFRAEVEMFNSPRGR